MDKLRKPFSTAIANGLLFSLLYSSPSFSQELNFSNSPLFIQNGVQPNILLVTDDSGSMGWEVLKSAEAIALIPDRGFDADGDWPGFSNGTAQEALDYTPNLNDPEEVLETCAGYNLLYYNPERTYTPWRGVDDDGNAFADQPIDSARDDPMDDDSDRDLTDLDGGRAYGYTRWNDSNSDDIYDSGECGVTIGATLDSTSVNTSTRQFIPVSAMSAAEQTNFANWYTFYRRRDFVAKKALLEVAYASEDRMGLGTINNNDDAASVIVDMSIAANKTMLMGEITDVEPEAAGIFTPLRRAIYQAGEYYKSGSGALFGYGGTNHASILPEADGGACQNNFTVLMTDGYAHHNGQIPPEIGNQDSGGAGDALDSDYDGAPYADTLSNTMADYSMKYFEEDLRTTYPDQVNIVIDGANQSGMHQHMITYTVAFGVKGGLNCNPLVDSGCSWPTAIQYNNGRDPASIDDLQHAAVNGRGEFLNASDPQALVDGIQDTIANIGNRTNSASAVAANSSTLFEGSVIYQSRFNASTWNGHLIRSPISSGSTETRSECLSTTPPTPEGQVCPGADVDAADNIASTRAIITSSGNTGIPFVAPVDWDTPTATEISTTQSNLLLANAPLAQRQAYGDALIAYLRGDQSNEATGSSPLFRTRTNILGDIVHSSPKYVGPPNASYPNTFGADGNRYSDFIAAQQSRNSMIYVGANDGMLHAVNATSMDVVMSYVPQSSYDNIADLALTNYTHQYFVDGSPTVGDAYFNNSWNTVLLGSHRSGGQGIFALNVTNPSNFSEVNADSIFMWEFTDEDDQELGYTYSQPDIVKLNTGEWAAVFGNGYNNTENDGNRSTAGESLLFVVNLQTGALIRKISTGHGTAGNPSGLSTATPVDINGDGLTDYVYAGDIQGNLFRFDLYDGNAANWEVETIFQAMSPSPGPTSQPITTRPSVAFHPQQSGLLVYFGTGKYLETTDHSSTSQQTQSFYAVWDDLSANPSALGRSDLLEQTITSLDTTTFSVPVRLSSNNTIDWSTHHGWYIDLILSNDNQGERVVTNSTLRGNRVVFVTTLPDEEPCNYGGRSALMEFNYENGGPVVDIPAFDLNGDGVFNVDDIVQSGGTYSYPSGVMIDGINSEPLFQNSTVAGREIKIMSNSGQGVTTQVESQSGIPSSSRSSWKEISSW